MKWFRKYPLLLTLTVSGLLLSLAGLWKSQGGWQENAYDVRTAPFSALVFRDIHDKASSTDIEPGDVAATETPEGQELDPAAEEEREMTAETGADETEAAAEKVYDFVQVDESYFDDAVFIGDSRTVGLFEYGGMEERATFYCKTSLTIWNVLEKPIVQLEGEKKPISVEEALSRKQFGKVYLMVGINELGRGNITLFMEQYKKVTTRIRELQPDAILFVEGIMRVAGEKNAEDPIFNNTNINARNEQIALLADQKDVFYIDVNEAVCDEEGNLNAEYTFDQIHLKAAYYQVWKQFLMEHGVVRDA